jgi:hypothetical protein
MTAVAAISGIAVLAGGAAQAQAASQSTAKGITATAKATPKCKVAKRVYHPVRTTVVAGETKVNCTKASGVRKVNTVITLFRNGKQVAKESLPGPKGKRYAYAMVSATMSGTKCQTWKVRAWTLAFNSKDKAVFEYAGTSKTKKICPR